MRNVLWRGDVYFFEVEMSLFLICLLLEGIYIYIYMYQQTHSTV